MKNLIGILIATLLISGMALADTQTVDIDTFAELQSWVSDETLLKAGTLTDTKYCIYDSASTDIICNSTPAGSGDLLADGSVPMTADFNLDGNNLDNGGVILLKEQADADADIAGQGQIWVNTATPNELWFTDDAGTDVQLGIDTTYTAGRSLTLDGTTVNADAELYTDQTGTYIESPVVESLNDLFLGFMNNITITYVKCKTDTGTVSINLEDGSDNNILSAELVCDAGGQTSCASGCDVNTINASYDNITAKTEDIDYDASATASSPTKISLMIGFTIDD